ncbi:MAG: protease inhibitor I42 family protein [Bacteroidota bacterium]|nr:protease inhibitor I42 family protein [Bacteroidota bacterium]
MPTDNTEEIKLKKGESTEIQLKGLSTAGYVWNYTTDADKNDITVSKDFVSKKLLPQIVGASADEVFKITANKTGVVYITFFQKRSWEKNTAPIDTKTIKLTIE